MSNGKGIIAVVSIIAITSLGVSGYLLLDKFYLSPQDGFENDNGSILVGLWENIKKTPDQLNPGINRYFNLTMQEFLDAALIEVAANNSEFRLKALGTYKIVISTLLVDWDIFRFRCYSSFDPDGFRIYSETDSWNQLVIEYIK
ncbi:MAG: hypothetical protein GF317_21080 [Candidatus Lokiarchaeota archaeon]|nr:hypothetical protein [Candidatus Lokiarchaeota archaeon]MBD3201939.1 hypothetical protein [Candidatus Lokiarchaeota archaeon]